MSTRYFKFIFAFFSLTTSLTISIATPFRAVASDSVTNSKRVTVIAMTDFHGALSPEIVKTANNESVNIGGASYIASYIKSIRESTSNPVVLIDAGDMFQGTFVSNRFEGEPVIKFYNSIGVDASAVGNHEFDYGPVGDRSVPVDSGDDPQGAIKARSTQAAFPFLAVNMVTSLPDENGQIGAVPSWAKASTVIERGGVRIGIIGAATPNTPATTVRKNLVGLDFIDPVEPILNEVARLKQEDAVDFIVLTMHEGVQCESVVDGVKTCKDGDLEKVLSRFPENSGIDLVIGGHSHKYFHGIINNIPVIEPGSHGKALGLARIEKGADSKLAITEIVNICGQVVDTSQGPSCDKTAVKSSSVSVSKATYEGQVIEEEEATVELMRPDFEKVAEIISKPLGVIANDDFNRSYYDESELGNLIVDLLRSYFSEPVDVSMTNNGGLRANLNKGPITYGSIYNIMP